MLRKKLEKTRSSVQSSLFTEKQRGDSATSVSRAEAMRHQMFHIPYPLHLSLKDSKLDALDLGLGLDDVILQCLRSEVY